jgi:pSer/pThr/pTyr-binding forkhead associated (FHA) protein
MEFSSRTWVNGRRIDSPVVVAEGDRVAIGESTIAVEDSDPAATVVRDA